MNIKTIERYINQLIEDETNFKNQSILEKSNPKRTTISYSIKKFINFITLLIVSIFDFTILLIKICFLKNSIKNKKIVFTAKNFCNLKNGKLVDRVVKPLFSEDIIFINSSKEYILGNINNQKVYNIGGITKVLFYFLKGSDNNLKYFRAYSIVNNCILRNLKEQYLYILWFYNLSSLSIIFSKYRKNFILCEVQHGSIINYPPYSKPSPIKIADIFYVKNEKTIDYLKEHLNKNYDCEYRLVPYPMIDRKFVPGIHLLYASTVEFNGIHPVFLDFLSRANFENLNVIIRLHPREKEKKFFFRSQIEPFNVNFEFDESENWLIGNPIKNLIVISPWSSSIEDSYDNEFITIIIDPVGRQRYEHLIDNNLCFYSDDIFKTLVEYQLITKTS
jgi:hypothetical protein